MGGDIRGHPGTMEQRLPLCPRAVSYTHLDVYKRQELQIIGCKLNNERTVESQILLHVTCLRKSKKRKGMVDSYW